MKRPFLICAAVVFGAAAHGAGFKLAPLFGDHMVLQHGIAAPVWGTAGAGDDVQVTINGKTAKTKAGGDGRWQVTLEPLPAGGPYTLEAASGGAAVSFSDILAGDVWICSGQSNMEMSFGWGVENGDAEKAKAANYPKIRLLNVPNTIAGTPRKSESLRMAWQVCDPATVHNFSAVGYFFGRDLADALDIPIGLIDATWSGTVAETWASAEKLRADCPEFAPAIQAMLDEEAGLSGKKTYPEIVNDWVVENEPRANAFTEADFDFNAWKTMPVPQFWEASVLPDFDGIVWISRDIDVPGDLAGKPAKLHLGMIDDEDITWFNGRQVGATAGWNQSRVYDIPAGLLKAGRNRIAVRVLDHLGGGGFHGDAAKMKLACDGRDIPLAGDWRFKELLPKTPMPKRPPSAANRPTACYNGMIAPLLPLAVKGAVWYQGCSNVGRDEQYQRLLPALIADWRARFTNDGLPFYIVQLSAFMQTHPDPFESGWGAMRWAQTRIGEKLVKNSGTAVTLDIGDHADIHPKNKRDVGARLARLALHRTYGKTAVRAAGPIPAAAAHNGKHVTVAFDTPGRVQAKNARGPVKGFAVAGTDRKFAWAAAAADGKTVVLTLPAGLTEPRFVRYAWDDYPDCNLTDETGLPAGSFELEIGKVW